MMRAFAVLIALTSLSLSALPAAAAGSRVPPREVRAVFRVDVAGGVPRGATFWVAYGPLGGHFGIIRLRRVARGRYLASRVLPARGRTVFAYLEGHGVTKTRFGAAPGTPVQTIRRVGPTTVWPHPLPLVRWSVPVG